MGNSLLVNFTRISPNKNSPRNNTIKKITIHHMAGNLTVETVGSLFASSTRNASSNYGIGTDGRVGMYVEEKDRAWTSSSADNDNQAVTIEVANNGGAPNWPVSDTALSKLIDLCVDICKRNGIKSLNYTGDKTGNLTRHNMFAATACPGPYLQSKFPYIADEVNKRLGGDDAVTKYVIVQPGGPYMGGIAKSNGISLSQLAEWNKHVTDVNIVHVGDMVYLAQPNTLEARFAALTRELILTKKVDPNQVILLESQVEMLKLNLSVCHDKGATLYADCRDMAGKINEASPTAQKYK